jgi:hypothetical protein
MYIHQCNSLGSPVEREKSKKKILYDLSATTGSAVHCRAERINDRICISSLCLFKGGITLGPT